MEAQIPYGKLSMVLCVLLAATGTLRKQSGTRQRHLPQGQRRAEARSQESPTFSLPLPYHRLLAVIYNLPLRDFLQHPYYRQVIGAQIHERASRAAVRQPSRGGWAQHEQGKTHLHNPPKDSSAPYFTGQGGQAKITQPQPRSRWAAPS